jgi:anti-anti-sigma factor
MNDRPASRAAQTWTLSVTSQLVDGKAVLLVSGRLGSHGASQLEAACRTAMEHGCRTLVIDLAGVDYLSSPGLRLFERLKTDLAAQGGSLAVTNPTDPVRLALDLAGMLEGLCRVE